MKTAILEIPTAGVARCFGLQPPEANEAFLHQVVLQRGIRSQPRNYLAKRLADTGVFDQRTVIHSVF